MRVLRILEYDGDQEWIEGTLRHSIERYSCPVGTITEVDVLELDGFEIKQDSTWKRPPMEVRNEGSSPASSTGYRTSAQRGNDAE